MLMQTDDPAGRGGLLTGDPAVFGAKLRDRRRALRMSMDCLAAGVGVARKTIWRWERGEVFPPAGTLAELGRALDVPWEQITNW